MPSRETLIDESKLPDDPAWRAKLEQATTQPDHTRPLTGLRWVTNLRGEDGNAWVIMGVVRKAIKATFGENWKEEAERAGKAARSGDYENLLRVARSYVEIVDVREGFLQRIEETE